MRGVSTSMCAVVVPALLGPATLAGPMLQPVAASSSMGQYNSQYAPSYAIDQSSMEATYVSGVTDFDTFVPSTKTASGTGGSFTTWYSERGVLTGNFDFDLGDPVTIDALGYWADPQAVGQGVKDFNLVGSTDAAFTSPIALGSYTALGNLGQANNYGQTFTFTPVTVRYVRMEILSNYGSVFVTGISEAAFRVADPGCPADMNGDGILDNGDIATFIAFFLAGNLAADSNGDGLLDNGDIITFVGQFLAGC